LQVDAVSCLPDANGISDFFGDNSLLTVAGAAPEFRESGSPASLLATKSCDAVEP
jgi:hypothetical protein